VGNFCDAPIMYDRCAQKLNVRLPFHYLGHFSRFVARGAHRILTTRYTDSLEACAFANPDGSHALVVLNRWWWTIPFNLAWGQGPLDRRIAATEAPPHSIQTIVW
jgi:glucosylceramidase